jgi:hypothetical protein
MGKTVRRGGGDKLVSAAWSTRSTVGKLIPNYGVTYLALDGTTVNETFILDSPDEGVQKRIIVSGSTVASTKTLTIRSNPTTVAGVSYDLVGNNALVYGVTSAAAIDGAITMVGLNSTRWGIISVRATTVTSI